MSSLNGDVFKPEDFVPVIDPPEGLSQKNTEKSFVLYRSEATMSRNIEVELGGFKVKSDWVVYFSRRLSLILQVLVTHGFVNFSNTGIVAVLKKPDFQSSEPVALQLGFVHKKGLHRQGRSLGQAVPDWRPLPRFHLLCLHVTSILRSQILWPFSKGYYSSLQLSTCSQPSATR